MTEQDALATFDFNRVVKQGIFLKWEAGKPLTLRVLTTDPVVSTNEFEGSDGELVLNTKFNFIVYNFTDEKAQILSATPNMAKKFGEIHTDSDFGGNIKAVDIKVSPTGEKLQRRYDIQVLPKARTLSAAQVEECRAINLDEKIDGGTRMSLYDPSQAQPKNIQAETQPDVVNDNIDDPINLDDIPF